MCGWKETAWARLRQKHVDTHKDPNFIYCSQSRIVSMSVPWVTTSVQCVCVCLTFGHGEFKCAMVKACTCTKYWETASPWWNGWLWTKYHAGEILGRLDTPQGPKGQQLLSRHLLLEAAFVSLVARWTHILATGGSVNTFVCAYYMFSTRVLKFYSGENSYIYIYIYFFIISYLRIIIISMIITFTKYDHKWDDIKTFNVSFIFVIILSYQYQWSQIWIFILNVLLTPREVDPPRHAGGQLENSLGGAGAQRAAKSLGEQNGNIWENGGLIWLNMMKKNQTLNENVGG